MIPASRRASKGARGTTDDTEAGRLRRRIRELDEELKRERIKNAFYAQTFGDHVRSEGTSTAGALSPRGLTAKGVSTQSAAKAAFAGATSSVEAPPRRPPVPSKYRLASEVLVIVDEQHRVPTALADLVEQAEGRVDLREVDTPRHSSSSPPTGQMFAAAADAAAKDLPVPPPADRYTDPTAARGPQGGPDDDDTPGVVTADDYPLDRIMTELSLSVLHADKALAVDPPPPIAIDGYNYLNAAYDKATNTFAHEDIPSVYSMCLQLCEAAAAIFKTEPLYHTLQSPCYVFGDTHGNFSDLSYFLDNMINFRDLLFTPAHFLFLGDYVDRGPHSLECVMMLLALKVGYRSQVTLLRGNHEDPVVNGDLKRYGSQCLLAQCQELFGRSRGTRLWECVNREVFTHLPLACDIEKKMFCVNAGIPRFEGGADERLRTLQSPQFPRLPSFAPSQNTADTAAHAQMVRDMCCSDMIDGEEAEAEAAGVAKRAAAAAGRGSATSSSSRPGASDPRRLLALARYGFHPHPRRRGHLRFAQRAVDHFLRNTGFEYIFRSHQREWDGVCLSKCAKVITVFSSSDYKGHRNGAGMLFVSRCGAIRLIVKKSDEEYVEETEERWGGVRLDDHLV